MPNGQKVHDKYAGGNYQARQSQTSPLAQWMLQGDHGEACLARRDGNTDTEVSDSDSELVGNKSGSDHLWNSGVLSSLR